MKKDKDLLELLTFPSSGEEVAEEDQLGDVLSNCRRHHPHRVQYRDIQREMELARTLKQ